MRKLLVLVLVLFCAGCGVSIQDHPEKLPVSGRVPDPAPSVTQVPESTRAPESSGSRQVPPPAPAPR